METLGKDAYEDDVVVRDLARMKNHIETAVILGRLEEFYVATCTFRSPKHFQGERRCVMLHDHERVVAMVGLGDYQSGLISGYDIRWVGVHPDFRGRRLAMKLYVFLIIKTRTRLWSGSQQTPDGRKLWLNLSREPGIEMRVISPRHVDHVVPGQHRLHGETHPLYNGKLAEDTRILAFHQDDPVGKWIDLIPTIFEERSILRRFEKTA